MIDPQRPELSESDMRRAVTSFVSIVAVPKLAAIALAQCRDSVLLLNNWPEIVRAILGSGASRSALTLKLRAGVVFDAPALNGRRLLRSNLLVALREIWLDKLYAPADMRIIDGDLVVDAGANLGFFTVFAARETPNGKVIAFEPAKSVLKYLKANVIRNRLANVVVSEKGIYDGLARHELWIDADNFGGHSLYAQRVQRRLGSQEAEFIGLDEIFPLYGISAIDLLKLDVEGAEFRILSSADAETLRKIRRIVMEYHTEHESDLATLSALLHSTGFSVRRRSFDAKRGIIWANSQ